MREKYAEYLQQVIVPPEYRAALAGFKMQPTLPDIEGPFYRPDAPLRNDFRSFDCESPEELLFDGWIYDTDGYPIGEGVLLDFWHAGPDGRYDNDDPDHPPKDNEFSFRGRQFSDVKSYYKLRTFKPGAYKIGEGKFRPAHIHVKLSKEGFTPLTTQLYFPYDPHNETDNWFNPSLVLQEVRMGYHFDFVLERV